MNFQLQIFLNTHKEFYLGAQLSSICNFTWFSIYWLSLSFAY